MASWFPGQDQAWAPVVGTPSPSHGLTEDLRPQATLIGVGSPRGSHLSAKTRLHPRPANSNAEHLRPNNQQDRNTVPPIKKKKKEMTKNMVQTKEQCKDLQDKINEEEIGNLPEKEFRE